MILEIVEILINLVNFDVQCDPKNDMFRFSDLQLLKLLLTSAVSIAANLKIFGESFKILTLKLNMKIKN